MSNSGSRHPMTWGTNAIATALTCSAQVVISVNHIIAMLLAITAGLAFITTIFLEYRQFPTKGRSTILISACGVGLLIASAELYSFLSPKNIEPRPITIQKSDVQPVAAPTPVSASTEGDNSVSISGGSNNSVTIQTAPASKSAQTRHTKDK